MKITVLAVGHLKEAHWRSAQREYLERLRHYASITVREVEDDGALCAAVPERARVVLLDERGSDLDSAAWAERIVGEAELRHGAQPLVFVIGGPDGLPAGLRARAWQTVAFGRATLPHRLARIVLLEQIYRAFTILRGLPYHR
ncbi:MAG: 23S rRNA (pseudouridine(1915)-N(3))-methyltransferase RlmH [Planctomycetes bacterium]|nr:23S rRNA (pseudouridine(1915)-N(3))-methyltransferase RlmH [Planctomycetota bacterium]